MVHSEGEGVVLNSPLEGGQGGVFEDVNALSNLSFHALGFFNVPFNSLVIRSDTPCPLNGGITSAENNTKTQREVKPIRAPMQAHLFSPAIDYKEQALQHMVAFEWADAFECLKIARDLDPYLADLELLARLCDFAQQEAAPLKSSAQKAVWLWHAAHEALQHRSLNEAEVLSLRRILARHLLAKSSRTNEVFAAKDKILLRGVCQLALENWQAAHDDLLNWVTAHADSATPRDWGYFGDAACALRLWNEANLAYARVLFLDPHAVDLLTFKHAQLLIVLQRLELRHEDKTLARSLWPFEAWRRRVLNIPAGNTFLLPVVQRQQSLLGSELMLERKQTLQQFMLCLYIDQAKLQERINFNVREEMKGLEPELFKQYLAEVEERRKS